MRRSGLAKRQVAAVLVAGGLSVGALLGTAGAASAANSRFQVTGDGPTAQAAKNVAASNAHDACVKTNGSGAYTDYNQTTVVGNSDGSWWVATLTVACN
ncbi:hypothetical protein [Streptomyces sp. NPDC002156]